MNSDNEDRVIVYRIEKTEDLLNHFAPKGYELLSDAFTTYMERIRPHICGRKFLKIQVVGKKLRSEEQSAVIRAIRTHYLLQLSDMDNRLRKKMVRLLWFFLSLIASAVLLFASVPRQPEVLTQFVYLPIWFFGYRILIYIILDIPAIWREKSWLKKLAGIKVSFEENGPEEASDLTKSGMSYQQIVQNYFIEDGRVLLECIVDDPSDMLDGNAGPDGELISDEMAAYLEQAVPFLKKDSKISLQIDSDSLKEGDLERIRSAIRNHFRLRIENTDQESVRNLKQIGIFALGLLLVSLLLNEAGSRVDVAYHEIILIILWFFGDYLVEFILLNPEEFARTRNRWIKMEQMEIIVIDRTSL